MKRCLVGFLSIVVLLALLSQPGIAEEARKQRRLPTLLTIDWKKGPNLPQGFQDSQGDIIGDWLISAGGFCSGQKGVPGKPKTYPRGFLKKVWALNLKSPAKGWRELPEVHGDARQGMQAIAVTSDSRGDPGVAQGGQVSQADAADASTQARLDTSSISD